MTSPRPKSLARCSVAGHLALVFAACALGGCATGGPAEGDTPTRVIVSRGRATPPPPRPASADSDIAYYRERVLAMSGGLGTEVARTDFERFRRGRFYLGGGPRAHDAVLWQRQLGVALGRGDMEEVVELTARILADDDADIRAHKWRAIALQQLGRNQEAAFEHEVEMSLLQSILLGGDGEGFQSAWTVYREQEEYALLDYALLSGRGYVVEGKSLTHDRGRAFYIFEARSPNNGARVRAYFDVTEMFAEEMRAMSSAN